MSRLNKYVILTEEKPSIWEVSAILTELNIKNKPKDILIKSIPKDYNQYIIQGIDNIRIYIIEGYGSLIDYLVYATSDLRNLGDRIKSFSGRPPLIALESTKTRPRDSGNSGPYQRIGKFVSLYKKYGKQYDNINKILFFDNDLSQNTPSFRKGVQICKSINVKVRNKYNQLPEHYNVIKPLKTIEDLTKVYKGKYYVKGAYKVLLLVRENEGVLEIQAKLAKQNHSYPKTIIDDNGKKVKTNGKIKVSKWKLDNDPNIGFTTSISFFVRFFSDKKDIKIRFINHGLPQQGINNSGGKWFQNMNIIKNYELEGLTLSDKNKRISDKYYFGKCSDGKEKLASILLDVLLREKYEKNRYRVIFSNHAGTEKTDIKTIDGEHSIPTIKQSDHLYPDLVMVDTRHMILHIIEGKIWKKRETMAIPELHKMDKFIKHTIEFLNKYQRRKITKVVKSLSLMAPTISYKDVMEWSENADFHVMHSINKDLNNTIEFEQRPNKSSPKQKKKIIKKKIIKKKIIKKKIIKKKSKTLKELKALCKSRGIKKYSKLRKAELIAMLQ